jgi:hypothetical protein
MRYNFMLLLFAFKVTKCMSLLINNKSSPPRSSIKKTDFEIPNNFIKVANKKNNSDDNGTSVKINKIPIVPLEPVNVAFLLIE